MLGEAGHGDKRCARESDFRQVAKVTGGHGMAVVGSAT